MLDATAPAASLDAASPRDYFSGGNSFPPTTPQHQISICPTQQLAHVDWLGFTINIADMGDIGAHDAMLWFLMEFHPLSDFFVYEKRRKGWMGYKESYDIEQGSGMLAVGGEHQRGTLHVEITAKGCASIKDWSAVQQWLERMSAKITRVDVAHDDHDGRTVNIDQCRRWLDEGLFSLGKKEPDRKLYDDLGTGKGRTLYVGKRANGKCFRGYEKGKQLGDKTSPWFRIEVEWRAKDRVIPYDVLTRPGVYLAGSYPAFQFLSAVQDRIKTIKTAVKVSVEQAVSNAKQVVGKLVNVLVGHLHWTPDAVVRTLRRDGIPDRLLPLDKHLCVMGAHHAPS